MTADMPRPKRPEITGRGIAWAVRADLDWALVEPGAIRRCRYGSPRSGFCGRAAVATLLRGRKRRPWAYCERHLYGRWIEGGAVRQWVAYRPELARDG